MAATLIHAISLSSFISAIFAAPVNEEKRSNSVSAASSAQISSFIPYIAFAHASYCAAEQKTWTCGNACQYGISDFVWHAGGGTGGAFPHWFVGYSPSLDSIILTHEGTDPTSLVQDLEDLDLIQTSLDRDLFPGSPSDIRVHNGFQNAFRGSVKAVRTAISEVMKTTTSTKITITGHSLGGALTQLSSVYVRINFPSLTIKAVAISSPRVGNPAFADYMESFDLTRINYHQDPVPILPGRFLGYQHAKGELHRSALDGVWYNCPGRDNDDWRCATGAVPNLLHSNIIDHGGPFEGIWLGTFFCH